MGARRVLVTGMGWVTPLGSAVDEVWSSMLAGKRAFGPVTRFDASTLATNFAAQVPAAAERPPELDGAEDAGLNTRFALSAAVSAWRAAGLDRASPDPQRVGMYLGSGEGTLDFEPFVGANIAGWDPQTRRVDGRRWIQAARERMRARVEVEQEPNMTLHHLARVLPIRGPAVNCMTACAASTQAVGEALEIIRRGDADVMVSGGAHTMIHPLGMTGFIRLTAMSTRRADPRSAARPFDQTRDGFVMGEGAGIVILESEEHARARGAAALAEVAGYGSTADAFRITDMHPAGDGPRRAMSAALRQAGIDPREPDPDGRPPIHYLSAHGTGTRENDSIETRAIKDLFGSMAPRIPISSIKSMIGHLIQAAGVVEIIACVQAIRTGWIPPTMNLSQPDPACDLDYVPNAGRDLRKAGGVRVCLSNSFGFGGQNDSVVLRAPER